MKKIGFVVEHLFASQLAFQLITSANELLWKKDDYDIIIYQHNILPTIIQPNFGTMCLYEAYKTSADTHLIATNLNSASRILDYPGTRLRYFYLQDLEWFHMRGGKVYEQLAQIYLNPALKLIARSKQHYDIIKSTWKEPIGIVPNANFSKFVELIEGQT